MVAVHRTRSTRVCPCAALRCLMSPFSKLALWTRQEGVHVALCCCFETHRLGLGQRPMVLSQMGLRCPSYGFWRHVLLFS